MSTHSLRRRPNLLPAPLVILVPATAITGSEDLLTVTVRLGAVLLVFALIGGHR